MEAALPPRITNSRPARSGHAFEPWLIVPRPRLRPRIKLFCFAYAGGSAAAFREWPARFDNDVEVLALQLPGRGTRLTESPLTEIEPLVAKVSDVIKATSLPRFAFFGHSMGALIAYEVCRALRRIGAPLPEVMFLSGRSAPHLSDKRDVVSSLPDAAFLSRLSELGGTPPEILSNPEFMSLFLPMLRADFKLLESWRYQVEAPLDLPIVACAGTRDGHVTVDSIEAWRAHTTEHCECWRFNGDHFFPHTQMAPLTAKIRDRLVQAVCA